MKPTIILLVFITLGLASCYKIPTEKGFLSPFLRLNGQDTMSIPLGGKGQSQSAFLDGSTQPCLFSIDNIRDLSGNRSGQFFKAYLYPTWRQPYDRFSDTTMALIKAKLYFDTLPPLTINSINGSLEYFETTNHLKSVGDVFHIDVKVQNTSGQKIYKNYATIRLDSGARPFIVHRWTVAIILLNNQGQKTFTLYKYVPETDIQSIQNVYDNNGKELLSIHKISDTPATGIKVLIQYLDADGNVFPSNEYATYAAGTESYFDYAVNRQNTPEGATVEFPITPWPVNENLLSYLKGGTYGFDKLDTATLHKEVYYEHKYPYLNNWPDDSWGATKWFIRLRSRIEFYSSGTWVISCKFPYTHFK
ncbi:MAG: hypothetical protein EPN37_10420 [Chitinophagaceae bacterium]|nr:MAG: hypothetical protein EPN37_10420 [Chitinophagaceae bacterium]